MNKLKKISIICFSGLGILIAGTGIAVTLALPHMPPVTMAEKTPFVWNNDTLAGDAVLSADQVQADTQMLIKVVEETHPIFLEEVPLNYQKAKADLLLSADQAMRLDDLQVLFNRYMSSLQDGHTQVYWSESDWLQLSWRCSDSQLFVLDESGVPTADTVKTIDGIPVENLMQVADKLFPAENKPAMELNYDEYLRSKRFLTLQGVKTRDTVEVEVLRNGSLHRIKVGFGPNSKLSGGSRGIRGKALNKDTYLVTIWVLVRSMKH